MLEWQKLAWLAVFGAAGTLACCRLDSAAQRWFGVMPYDVRTGIGLNRQSDDYFIGTGFAVRY